MHKPDIRRTRDAAAPGVYEAVTHDIRVRVTPHYLEEDSAPHEDRYVWAYTVDIHNEGSELVQLRARHWRITDANGRTEEVKGRGVVGETPVMEPGGSFRYTSSCRLSTPSGIMVGSYQMATGSGATISVAIPAFSLDSPHSKPRLN